jgi:hypothetical protein
MRLRLREQTLYKDDADLLRLNAFKLEMPVHPQSRVHTHYFA